MISSTPTGKIEDSFVSKLEPDEANFPIENVIMPNPTAIQVIEAVKQNENLSATPEKAIEQQNSPVNSNQDSIQSPLQWENAPVPSRIQVEPKTSPNIVPSITQLEPKITPNVTPPVFSSTQVEQNSRPLMPESVSNETSSTPNINTMQLEKK